MTNAEELLTYLKDHINEWACSSCGCNSSQPAATFRILKNQGWQFEEVAPQRWGQQMLCNKCNRRTTHYKLISLEKKEDKSRIGITHQQRSRVIRILSDKDAFTGASVKSSLEIDHKIPFGRLKEGKGDIDIDNLTDEEIPKYFQILTRDHNLLKDRACQSCIKKGIRPPFLGINFWYEGDCQYNNSCEGCGWFDGTKWRCELNELLMKEAGTKLCHET